MDVLRTADQRFEGLPDFPFRPHYVEVPDGDGGRLRVHHLDEGPRNGPVVVLMHGEPSWCFLYRHMIPVLTAAGLRCLAPDLVGFGRSDKPSRPDDYTYARHVSWMQAWLDEVGASDLTLVGQDWGGLIGLRLVAADPGRFSRVVAANTFLPTGTGRVSDAFLDWQRFSQEVPAFPAGRIVDSGCTTDLTPEVVAAYDAPFPEEAMKAGARRFPLLVPTRPDDPEAPANQAAWEVLASYARPFLCAFSDADPITAGSDRALRERIPGCAGQPHTTIVGGGHFLQEDRGPELARIVADWVQSP
ncbi:MAG: haloalkane dehalogenase [Actinomycetes bacterium]